MTTSGLSSDGEFDRLPPGGSLAHDLEPIEIEHVDQHPTHVVGVVDNQHPDTDDPHPLLVGDYRLGRPLDTLPEPDSCFSTYSLLRLNIVTRSSCRSR